MVMRSYSFPDNAISPSPCAYLPQKALKIYSSKIIYKCLLDFGTAKGIELKSEKISKEIFMSHLIEVKNAYKIYNPGENEVRALDGVSLTVDRGEFLMIVGHSGSGKSTLMNMLGLLDICTSGEYRIDGKDVSNLSDDELSEIRNKEIGFIFQGFNLIPSLTAKGNVELPLIYRGVKKDEREKLSVDALRRVGLEKRMNHLPSQMSGGQQQRVAIARAVAARPPVILADEPTGNLDSASGKEVMKILHELNDEGRTIILITHDNEIAEEGTRVVRVSDGKIIEDRPSRKV